MSWGIIFALWHPWLDTLSCSTVLGRRWLVSVALIGLLSGRKMVDKSFLSVVFCSMWFMPILLQKDTVTDGHSFLSVLISVFASLMVCLWQRLELCVCMCVFNQQPTKQGICGSEMAAFLACSSLRLSREHHGIANRTEESSSHPSGPVYCVEDVHRR